MNEWISVSERLPIIPKNKSGIVLDLWTTFNLNGRGVRFADALYEYRTSDRPEFHGNGSDIRDYTVTHWMIVEPPKQ